MPTLFDGTSGSDDIVAILDRMAANIPRPFSNSRSLWRLRHATNVSGHNVSRETLLERAVAMLAARGHMQDWFNQCPAASGIGDSSNTRHSSVDLVRWCTADRRLSLVELKWNSGRPSEAVRQVLRYGAAYLFCRMHRNTLPVGGSPAMSAAHLELRVVAPARYYVDDALRDCVLRAREAFAGVPARTGLPELSMSLDVLAFPDRFDRLPFANGAEVRESCGGQGLTPTGRKIVDAFDGLASVCDDR